MTRDPLKLRHPFFLPKGRRVLATVFCCGWAVLELAWGNALWFAFFAAISGYMIYHFFIVFDPKDYENDGG